MKMYRILICDDDKAIVDSISIYLNNEGFETEKAYDGLEAVKKLEENEFHCLILDIMMPNLDGLAAANIIRKKHNLPIIMLSAKSEDTDKIAGLQFGADDYVTKPFNPLELVARVKAQIRRYSYLGSLEKKETMLITDALVLDTDAKSVTVDGEPVKLTAIEFKIVRFLMENMGKIMSSSQIYEAVWNEVPFAAEKTVTVHVRNIRSKIEIDPKNPKYLKVVYGVGYKIEKY
ncbi:MAG: response regulator transcription factor [Clostridia bacterium]|nr:response regulator transcription factor [Clostridia bacterium]